MVPPHLTERENTRLGELLGKSALKTSAKRHQLSGSTPAKVAQVDFVGSDTDITWFAYHCRANSGQECQEYTGVTMKLLLVPIPAVACLALILCVQPAQAGAIYTYTGNDLNQGTLPITGRVTGSFTVPTAIAPDTSRDSIIPEAWAFAYGNGFIHVDSIDGYIVSFIVSTDGSGNINLWDIDVNSNPAASCGFQICSSITTDYDPRFGDFDYAQAFIGSALFAGSNLENPGAWVEVNTPEPLSWTLVAAGILAMGCAVRQKGAVAGTSRS